MNRYVDSFVQKNIGEFMPNQQQAGLAHSEKSVSNAFEKTSHNSGGASGIHAQYEKDRQLITTQAGNKGIASGMVDSSPHSEVDNEISKQKVAVNTHHVETEQGGKMLERKYNDESGKRRHSNLLHDAVNGINTKDN